MEIKDYLTSESIKKRFNNQFDLVNYAIGVAKEMIHSGRAPRIKAQTENPALIVLEEIVSGKERLEEKPLKEHAQKIDEEEPEEEIAEAVDETKEIEQTLNR